MHNTHRDSSGLNFALIAAALNHTLGLGLIFAVIGLVKSLSDVKKANIYGVKSSNNVYAGIVISIMEILFGIIAPLALWLFFEAMISGISDFVKLP